MLSGRAASRWPSCTVPFQNDGGDFGFVSICQAEAEAGVGVNGFSGHADGPQGKGKIERAKRSAESGGKQPIEATGDHCQAAELHELQSVRLFFIHLFVSLLHFLFKKNGNAYVAQVHKHSGMGCAVVSLESAAMREARTYCDAQRDPLAPRPSCSTRKRRLRSQSKEKRDENGKRKR